MPHRSIQESAHFLVSTRCLSSYAYQMNHFIYLFLHRRNPCQKKSSVTFSVNIGSEQRSIHKPVYKLECCDAFSQGDGSSDVAVRLKRNELLIDWSDPSLEVCRFLGSRKKFVSGRSV